MNYSMIWYILGWVLNFEAVFMLVPCITALFYREQTGFWFLGVAAAALVAGLLLIRKKPVNKRFYAKEGLVIVAMSWIVLSLIGALPMWLSGEIPHFVDAMFETVSGFTTTGASILPQVEVMSNTVLMWRSFTHWIGGMGVLVFVMAILPLSGGYNMYLMKAESPGPAVSKLVPRVRTTAIILYIIYFAMTVLEILLLVCGGMSVFDALNTGFATAGTGGFGIKNDSLAGYSAYIQVVVTIFMILFGVNFNMYFLLLSKKVKHAFAMTEVRVYFAIIAVSILIITCNVFSMFQSVGEALRHAAFQVASIISTTGFMTEDFNLWPAASKDILVVLMFVGSCAGSTGGGMKVSRFILFFKSLMKELGIIVHPRGVKIIKIDGRPVEHEVMRSVNVFMVAYMFIFALSVLIVSFDNFDMTTNFTAVAATIGNIGPGLEIVGPTQNYAAFSGLSKVVLMFDMLAGRLEIFPMLILFKLATWRKK